MRRGPLAKGFLLPMADSISRIRRKSSCGGQTSFGFEDSIQEPGLIKIVDGRRFVDAGGLFHGDAELTQATLRFAEIFFAIADVAPES